MKKIIYLIFSVCILFNMGCDDEYDTGALALQNDARVIRVSIDVRDVPFDSQRTFYNHDLNEVIVHVLPGMDWTSFTVFVSPVLFATMTPDGGQIEDWSTGRKSYTITSGDGAVSNTYEVIIEEVVQFGDNDPWG